MKLPCRLRLVTTSRVGFEVCEWMLRSLGVRKCVPMENHLHAFAKHHFISVDFVPPQAPPPLSNYFSELAFFDPFFTTITLHGM